MYDFEISVEFIWSSVIRCSNITCATYKVFVSNNGRVILDI